MVGAWGALVLESVLRMGSTAAVCALALAQLERVALDTREQHLLVRLEHAAKFQEKACASEGRGGEADTARGRGGGWLARGGGLTWDLQ